MALSSNLFVHPDHVYTSPWTNWNDDGSSSYIMVMPSSKADLTNIFLGIFVFFVEARWWSSMCFILFLIHSRHGRQRRDGLHHQLLAVFRNGSSSLSTAATLYVLLSLWGRRRNWGRILPLITLAALCFAAFVVGMPFALAISMLDKLGDEIRIHCPENCGFWATEYTQTGTTAPMMLANQSREAVAYVDLCYNSNEPSNNCDRHLAQRHIRAPGVNGAYCPFPEEVCLFKNKFPAKKWETEKLDSHVHFGINAALRDRIQIRRTTVCAPLDVDRFTRVTKGTMPAENITALYFGPKDGNNHTFMASSYQVFGKTAYHLDNAWYYPANGSVYTARYTPIPQLLRTDADVTIVSLNNEGVGIQSPNGPCRDPFFSATKRDSSGNGEYYYPDRPMTAIGCTDQYAFGNPVTGQWSRPMGVLDTADWGNFTKNWKLTRRQIAAIASLQWAIYQSGGINLVIVGLQNEALLAKKVPGMFSGFQNPIPNDQWVNEVSYWFNIGLAKLQLGVVGIALGPQNPGLPDLQNYLSRLVDGHKDILDMICSSQKVHSPEHKNYHFWGLIGLLAAGAFVILFGILLTQVVSKIPSWRGSILRWNSYSNFQLLRMATEAAGVTGWERLEKAIPRLQDRDAPAGDIDIKAPPTGVLHPQWASSSQQACNGFNA